MKKLLVVLVALSLVLLCCGCGSTAGNAGSASAPEASAEAVPTPEPTERAVSMSCGIAEALDADTQYFLESIDTTPAEAAIIELGGQYPKTVVLDESTISELCSALTAMTVTSQVFAAESETENSVTFYCDGESYTVSFLGDRLSSRGYMYTLENSDAFWQLLSDTCSASAQAAAENLSAIQSGANDTFYYDKSEEARSMTITHTEPYKVGADDGCWQKARTTFTLTNTASRNILFAMLRAEYVDANGYVVGEGYVTFDFTSGALYAGESRSISVESKVFNYTGSEDFAAVDVILYTDAEAEAEAAAAAGAVF